MLKIPNLQARVRASAIHLLFSLVAAALCAALVFGLWYPAPYAVLAGGVTLFLLVTGVDVVLGPLLTLVAFNTTKSRAHLWRDLITIALLQFVGLVYGLHTVYVSRPVVLAAENSLFRVVAASEIETTELAKVKKEFQKLSLTGPRLVGVRPAKDSSEKLDSISLALQGFDGGARPLFWEDYELSRPRLLKQMKRVESLEKSMPNAFLKIDATLKKLNREPASVGYLEVKARVDGWILLLDHTTAFPIEFVNLN
jgi:hypothetical protein